MVITYQNVLISTNNTLKWQQVAWVSQERLAAGKAGHSLVTVAADGPLEESSAAVAGRHTVVLARSLVPTHPARRLPALHL